MNEFAQRLIHWQAGSGRHDLPWQRDRDPYRIWLSEIMLQQTQVDTVIPYFLRFLERFPDLAALAAAPVGEVLAQWSGLGYYARARNLHACARRLAEQFGGEFPRDCRELAGLPGIGRSTAAAIAVFAFGERAAILDGNVKRVLCRHFGVDGPPSQAAVEARLWSLAESLLPGQDCARYIQAQMDLGATVCTRHAPRCGVCPLQDRCVAHASGRTAELPAPRPRKSRRLESRRFLVIRRDDRVLLERRPAIGLWGGLLALPEYDGEGAALNDWLARRTGLRGRLVGELPALRHMFTHFTLDMLPLLVELGGPATALGEPGWEWLELAELANAGLPTPVRRILAGLPLRPAAEAGAGADRAG